MSKIKLGVISVGIEELIVAFQYKVFMTINDIYGNYTIES